MTQSQIWHHAPLKLSGLSVNVSKGWFEKVVEMSTDSFLGVKFWPATLSSYLLLGHVEVVNFCCCLQVLPMFSSTTVVSDMKARNLKKPQETSTFWLVRRENNWEPKFFTIHHGHLWNPHGSDIWPLQPRTPGPHPTRPNAQLPRRCTPSGPRGDPLGTCPSPLQNCEPIPGAKHGATWRSWARQSWGVESGSKKGLDVPKKVKSWNMEHIYIYGFI